MSLQQFTKYTEALEYTLPGVLKEDPFAVDLVIPAQGAESIVSAYFKDVKEAISQANRYELYATKCFRGIYGYVVACFDDQGNFQTCYAQQMWCFDD